MKLKLLMISGDRKALKPGPVQRRLMHLAERIGELHVVVPAERHRQQLDSNVWVYGSGGSSRLGQWAATFRLASKLVRDHSCQVITSQDPFELGLAAYLVSRATKAKLHLQDHSAFLGNAMFPKISRRRWLQWHLGKWLVRRASRIRTVSQRGAHGLAAAGANSGKVDVVPIPVDISKFSELASTRQYDSTKTVELVYIGRLEQEKGVEVLIRAMQPSWHLTVVGSGSLLSYLSNLASALNASVTWIEHQADVAPYMAKASIAVVPSLTEGWGLAAIEAAVAGLPIVMTDVGCAGELLVDGESALVVPPGDSGVLSAAIARLAADASLRQRLGQAAARAAQSLPDAATFYQAAADSYAAAI